jgi:NTE family protein
VPEPLQTKPDVLVLAAGGTLGEAWMRGLLDGISAESGIDFRRCEYFVGTSAGSIVAAVLAAGQVPRAGDGAALRWSEAAARDGDDGEGPDRSTGEPSALQQAAHLGLTAASPLVPLALASSAPGGAAARAVALKAIPRPKRRIPGLGRLIDSLGGEFDGRLRIVAVDRRNGRRVVFGAPGAPAATVSQAVMASCAVPWIFAPVKIDGREYVDGGVWSPTNLDVTPAGRGIRVMCLNPAASLPAGRPPFGALRAVARTTAFTEALALRARGASVRTIAPDEESARRMGLNLMDRKRVGTVLEAAYAQGRKLAG